MDKTELTPASPSDSAELAEQQLTVTLDDIEQKKRRVMSTEDYLKIQKALNTTAARKRTDEAPDLPAAAKPAEQNMTAEPSKPAVPTKAAEAPKAPASKPESVPRTAPPNAPHLSDMEVMEHTASIWQYKEIADNGTEMHSEYHEKRTVTPFAEIIGARVRGKKHKHEGTNCDDYFETAVTEDCAVVVVCDGAGSKPLSRIGSRVSAESAAAYLKTKTEELFGSMPALKAGLAAKLDSAEFMAACGRIAPLVQEAAREAFAAQQKALGELDKKYEDVLGRKPVIGDLSTTFLAAVIVPVEVEGKPQTFMACVQIGDGCICAVDSAADSAHCLKLLGEADSGAFSGETDFLSEKNSKAEVIGGRTRISRGSSDTVLLMTDGVADDYFPAQPMMERLCLDLCLNGILPMSGEHKGGGEDPAPIRFRSVSLTQQSVALQYAKQLLGSKGDKTDAAMAALWDKRDMLWCHSLEAFRMNIGDTPEERLRVWLDNYNERGSFDDRTLAVVRMTKKRTN